MTVRLLPRHKVSGNATNAGPSEVRVPWDPTKIPYVRKNILALIQRLMEI